MIITKFVNVKIGGKNIKHYNSLGYEVKLYSTITVPIEHLSEGSHYIVEVQCDYCQSIVKKAYKGLLLERKNSHTKKDCCSKCIPEKNKDTNMELYGVENTLQRDETKEKIKKTNVVRYGFENPSMSEENRLKKSATMLDKSSKEKMEIREKTEKTNLNRFGVACTLLLDKCRRNLFKVRDSESSQQKKIYEILIEKYGKDNVFSNYYESKLSLDILVVLENIKINVEYDSWYWHTKSRDRRRDEFLKGKGYKVLRIKSGRKIPNKELLFSKIENLSYSKKKYSEIVLNDWNEEGYSRKEGDNEQLFNPR